jgi:hypothetical protein
VVAGFLLAGCSGDDDTASQPTSGSVPSSSSTGAPASAPGEPDTADDGATAPPFLGNAEPDTGEASADARVTVSDIRIGRHHGFDRVVFEVGGQGLPGWDVRYVDEATSQGSGEPVDVAGEAVLQVTLTGVGYPGDTGVAEFSSDGPLSVAATEVVTEVVLDSTFEGATVAFVGTQVRMPFRVYLLEGPARAVLEVAHTG